MCINPLYASILDSSFGAFRIAKHQGSPNLLSSLLIYSGSIIPKRPITFAKFLAISFSS